MRKDSTSKRKTAPTKTTRQKLRAKLARDLAAVIDNPECPDSLFRDITDRMTDFSSCIDFDSAKIINEALDAFYRQEAKRKGGAR